MDLEEKQIQEILEDIVRYPIELFSFRTRKTATLTIVDVVLDHLENPYGSVSLDDCEFVSKELLKRLEPLFPDQEFQLRVQSAGAERKLKLPRDLYRFVGLKMNLEYINSLGVRESGIFRLVEAKDNLATLEPYSKTKPKNTKTKTIQVQIEQIKKGNLVVIF